MKMGKIPDLSPRKRKANNVTNTGALVEMTRASATFNFPNA
jgi:hypothetical protein